MQRRVSGFEARWFARIFAAVEHNHNLKPAELACQKKAFSQVSNDKAYSFFNFEILHLESR
jgi:hypothetical protein